MASYIIRKIDPVLWAQVKTRAHDQGHELRGLFVRFLRAYARGLSIDAVDPVVASSGDPTPRAVNSDLVNAEASESRS